MSLLLFDDQTLAFKCKLGILILVSVVKQLVKTTFFTNDEVKLSSLILIFAVKMTSGLLVVDDVENLS